MVYDFEQQLSKIEQGCMDVSTYYTQIMTLWEEHKNYVELHVCIRGDFIVSLFIYVLNASYNLITFF